MLLIFEFRYKGWPWTYRGAEPVLQLQHQLQLHPGPQQKQVLWSPGNIRSIHCSGFLFRIFLSFTVIMYHWTELFWLGDQAAGVSWRHASRSDALHGVSWGARRARRQGDTNFKFLCLYALPFYNSFTDFYLLHLILSIMTIFRKGDARRQSECDRCVPGQHPSLQP